MDRLRPVLEADLRIAYALVFGSRGRRAAHAGSDVDVAIGLARGARLSAREVGDLVSRLEAVAGAPIDLVILDEAGPVSPTAPSGMAEVILMEAIEEELACGAPGEPAWLTPTVVATKIAAIRDAVARIRRDAAPGEPSKPIARLARW